MSRHLVLIAAGLMILVAVWFAQVIRPKLEHPTITVDVDGQTKTMDKAKIEATFQELRNKADAARKEADALKATNAGLLVAVEQWQARAQHGSAGTPPKADPGATGPGGAAGSKGEELRRLLESTDFSKYTEAIVKWAKADGEMRTQGTPIKLDPETMNLLVEYRMRLLAIGRIVGVSDPLEVPYDEKVSSTFFKGWIKGMGVTLDADQEARLGETCYTCARSRAEELKSLGDANRLQKLAWAAGRDLQWSSELRKLLAPAQYDLYMKPIGADAFWAREAPRQSITSDSPAGASKMVGGFWASSFGLGDAARTTVDEVASRYVQDVQRRQQEFQARYAGNAPREEQMRLQVDLVKMQADAERQLGQRLTLTPEQQAQVKAGTGTVLQLGWK